MIVKSSGCARGLCDRILESFVLSGLAAGFLSAKDGVY